MGKIILDHVDGYHVGHGKIFRQFCEILVPRTHGIIIVLVCQLDSVPEKFLDLLVDFLWVIVDVDGSVRVKVYRYVDRNGAAACARR